MVSLQDFFLFSIRKEQHSEFLAGVGDQVRPEVKVAFPCFVVLNGYCEMFGKKQR